MLKLFTMKFRFFILFSLTISAVFTQANIVSSGTSISNSSGSFSNSIGQIDYISVSSNGGSLNQGNQQAFEIFESNLNENSNIQLSAFVYPNPTNNFVLLKIQEIEIKNLSYRVFDSEGKEISSNSISNLETKISFSQLSSGTYFIKVFQENSEIKSFKIIKNL